MATNQEAIKLYLPVEDADRVRKIAKAQDRSVANVLRRAVNQYLQNHPDLEEANQA